MKILYKTTGAVIYEDDSKTIKATVVAAYLSGADLSGATITEHNVSDLLTAIGVKVVPA